MLYQTFLFLHIVGVVAWLGGAFTLTILNIRLAREPSPTVRESVSSAGEFFGRRVFGPAAGLTLVAGIVMIGLTGWRVPAWVIWGLCALFASGFVGSTLVRRAAHELVAASPSVDSMVREPGRIATLQRRLLRWSALDLLILLSAVCVMVFKPAL